MITAKHIVESLTGAGTIGMFSNGEWSPLHVTLVGHAPADADISVLAANQLLTPQNLPMEATSEGLIYGQDAYFLGYPYGFTGQFMFGSGGYPLPFVKKAVVSLLNMKKVFLDGHNNPGFSGGPVIFSNTGNTNYKVAAVISGYRIVEEPVFAGDKQSGLTYRYNTGIIVADTIAYAIEIIQEIRLDSSWPK